MTILGFRLHVALAGLLACASIGEARAAAPASWPAWGGPLTGNQRSAPTETVLTPATVGGLAVKWEFTTKGSVTATPAVDVTGVYATDDGGGVYRINAATGAAVWTQSMPGLLGTKGAFARSSPALSGSLAIVADKRSGTVLALNKTTGALVWKTVVETQAAATGGSSPVISGTTVLVGTSSSEEGLARRPGYVPSFRGSIVALNLNTGKVLWQSYMTPAGYTGTPVWGSAFAVVKSTDTVFAATGNNYSVTPAATACLQNAVGVTAQLACLDPADYVDAIVALDLGTGAVKWAQRVQGADTYTDNCTLGTNGGTPCPVPAGPDYDFGAQPLLFTGTIGGRNAQLVGDGQKSGTFWALDPITGAIVWQTVLGPGGGLGGIEFGSATDGTHVYVAENDTANVPYTLAGSGQQTTGGSCAALAGGTGAILWQVAAPGMDLVTPGAPAGATGAVTVAAGVLYGGTTGGTMVALDAASGAQLWSFESRATVRCGPAVANGIVYWGAGAANGVPGTSLYAFAPP